MELKQKAYILTILAVMWASMQPIFLSFGRGTEMNTFFLLVYAIAIPASLAFVVSRGKLKELRTALSDWRKVAILAVIGLVLFIPTEYGVTYAETYVSASLVAVMLRMSPLLMLMLLPIVLRERLSKYQILALSLGFVGIYIALSGGSLFGVFSNSSAWVIGLLALMAFVYSFSIILIRKYVFDISVILFGAAVTMFLLLLGINVASGLQLQPLTSLQIGIAAILGVTYNVIGYSIFYTYARVLKATVSANILSFSPFLTFILAGIILGQPVYAYYVVIALLAVVGIVMQSFDKVGGAYVAKSNEETLKRMTIFDVTGIFANTGELAINSTIKDGGRVLAVRFDAQHADKINGLVGDPQSTGVYTASHEGIGKESAYVKDVLGARPDDIVVMKAGKLDECEKFLHDLYSKIIGV